MSTIQQHDKDHHLLDEQARDKIKHIMDRNYFVEASAGSGKTTTLVDRMVALVESGFDQDNGVKISEIAAITFTKAAANEFQSRFQAALDKKRREAGDLHHRQLYEQALGELSFCFMGTIDSFCNRLISEHPVEAHVPVLTQICEEDDLIVAYHQEWMAMLRGEYGQDCLERYWDLEAWGIYTKSLRDQVKSFADKRDVPCVFTRFDAVRFWQEMVEYEVEIRELFRVIKLNNLVKPGKGIEETYRAFSAHAWAIETAWVENPGPVFEALKAANSSRQPIKLIADPGAYSHLNLADYTELTANRKDYVVNLDPIVKRFDEARYALVMTFITDFAKQAAERLRKQGKLGFADNLIYLRDMLRDDTARGGHLIRYIAGQHKYFLVDEFQDTNPLQAQILFYLTASDPVLDWRQCQPRPGTLFIVGDPKQSIYRFSQADISIFQDVKQLIVQTGGEVLTLYHNYRSREILRDWFDRTFCNLMPENSRYQPRYNPIAARPDTLTDATLLEGAYKYHIPVPEKRYGKEIAASNADAAVIVRLIQSLVKQSNQQIMDRKKKLPRPVEYHDIMIITGTKVRLSYYMQALRQAGIPFTITGKTSFDQCEALQNLTLIIAAMASPQDELAVAASLKSSAFSLSDEDLYHYVAAGGKFRLFSNRVDPEQPVGQALRQLSELRRVSTLNPLLATVLTVLVRLELAATHLANDDDQLDYLFFALELMRAAIQGGSIVSLSDARDFLNDLLINKNEREMQLTQNANAVKIINLHKAKGLQAPVVILADPMTGLHGVSESIDRGGEMPARYVFSMNGSNYQPIVQTHRFQQQAEEEDRHRQAERDRLIYVAATRAENLLIISSLADELDEKNAWQKLVRHIGPENLLGWQFFSAEDAKDASVATDLADLNSQNLQPQPERPLISRLELQQTVQTTREALERASCPSYVSIKPSELDKPESAQVKLAADSAKSSESAELQEHPASFISGLQPLNFNAAQVGTDVHKILEILVQNTRAGTLDAKLRSILDVASWQLSEKYAREYPGKSTFDSAQAIISSEAQDPSPYRLMLLKVGELFITGQLKLIFGADQSTMPLIDVIRSADVVYCEMPFQVALPPEHRTLVSGTMDLVIKIDARWMIVDYKTNLDPVGLEAKYAGQLAIYREVFEAITGEKAETSIVHVPVEGK